MDEELRVEFICLNPGSITLRCTNGLRYADTSFARSLPIGRAVELAIENWYRKEAARQIDRFHQTGRI